MIFIEIKENFWVNSDIVVAASIKTKSETSRYWIVDFHIANTDITITSGVFESKDQARKWLESKINPPKLKAGIVNYVDKLSTPQPAQDPEDVNELDEIEQ